MSKPNLRAVNNEVEHPRDIARRKVKEWRSDAEREGLPLVNVTTDSGAPVLDRDKVLRRSLPNCVGLR